MATLQLVESIFAGLVHPTTGALLASCKARFYDLGTLTPQTVYSDAAGATPITQPLTLTAAGQGVVYTAGPVRCIIKDSLDTTTIYDVTAINASVPAAQFITSSDWNGGTQTTLQTILDLYSDNWGGSAGYWKYKQSSGATEVTPKSWMSNIGVQVSDFGAVGDDATDNTTSIQNAINAIIAAGGGTLLFPPGTFRISSALTTSGSGALSIRGAGITSTTLKQTSATANSITISTLTGLVIADMSIAASSTSGTGLALPSSMRSLTLANLKISGHENGISGIGGVQVISGVAEGAALLSNLIVDPRSASTGSTLTGTFDNTVIVGGTYGCASTGGTGYTNLLFVATSATSSFCTIIGAVIAGGNRAIDLPAGSLLLLSVTGGAVSSGLTDAIRIAATCTTHVFVDGSYHYGTDADARTGSPVGLTLAGSGSITPWANVPFRALANGAGSTVTVNPPNGNVSIVGKWIEILCINNSGGAVTWTFNAVYKTSAAVAPATANCTAIRFSRDPISNVWREETRATAAI